MGVGRSIAIPPSIHHKTGNAYRWIDPGTGEARAADWELPPLDELPVIDDGDLERLREALEPWSRKPKPPQPPLDGPAPILSSATARRYRAYALACLESAQQLLPG